MNSYYKRLSVNYSDTLILSKHMPCNKRTAHFGRAGIVFLLILILSVSGCAQLGPDLVKAGRNEYNKVLAQTNDEETLMNLVRLRYSDNPIILQVSSVSTSFTWRQGVSLESEIFEGSSRNNSIGPGGNLDYSERPTITYTPLAGADYVKKVLTPMELDTLILLERSGWSLERLLRVTVNQMNGLQNASQASGPTPRNAPSYKEFNRAAALLRSIKDRGGLVSGYVNKGEAKVAGFRFSAEYKNSSEIIELSKLLGIAADAELITVDTVSHTKRKDTLGLEMRSLAGISFFLSHGVQVPPEDVTGGVVRTTKTGDNKTFDWNEIFKDFFIVHSQAKQPDNAAISVNYRGKWFYIDDADIQTKYTFMLLRQLTQLQEGRTQTSGPLLTLPVR